MPGTWLGGELSRVLLPWYRRARPQKRANVLFERVVSKERDEPPDIDVDFEHNRREEIIQYIYKKCGRHRAALCATVSAYRTKGALRDVGKALGGN